jgi:hypothetical protein
MANDAGKALKWKYLRLNRNSDVFKDPNWYLRPVAREGKVGH